MIDPTAETSVYLYYDNTDVLIYVGITQRGSTRNSEHNKLRSWWQYVARQEIEHHPTRTDALLREAGLIRRFRPPFNVQHNTYYREMRHAYELYASGNAIAQDPKALLKSLSGKIPLHFFGEDDHNGHIFRTEAAHVSIGFRLQEFNGAKLINGSGTKIGRVTEICQCGPFVLIHTQPHRGGIGVSLDGAPAFGIVKHLNNKKPIGFALRGIRLDTARIRCLGQP